MEQLQPLYDPNPKRITEENLNFFYLCFPLIITNYFNYVLKQ